MYKAALTYKRLVIYSTAFVFLFSSVSQAAEQTIRSQQTVPYATGAYAQQADQAKPLWETSSDRQAKNKETLNKMGYSVKIETDKVVVNDPSSGKPVMEFPNSDEATLRKFSPKSLSARMMQEMGRVKAANGEAFSHSLRNLPSESAIFFMAMGAVVATQLITNYSANPVAMQQHIEHSVSPLGVFGFYTFMYSQGVTSNVLSMYLRNPAFQHMIPYLGMTVGFFVQSYMSQIIADPNVKVCAKTLLGGKVTQEDQQMGADADPCSKAYEYLVIQRQLWKLAPGLVSMLASTAFASLGQYVATQAVLKITGFDIATLFVPVGGEVKMTVKVIRLLAKGLQISSFLAIDALINRQINLQWKNIFDSAEIGDLSEAIEKNINDQKNSQWKADSKELQANLTSFRQKMAEWRQANLSEVYEAYQNWTANLQQLTGMYNASYAFYNDFLSQVQLERAGSTYVMPLERKTPFYGITANLNKDQENFLLSDPAFIESKQYETVVATAGKSEAILKSAPFAHFNANEKSALVKIDKGLHTQDIDAITNAILLLNSEIRVVVQNRAATNGYYEALWTIYTSLGAPRPILEKGRGWTTYYRQAPSTAAKVANVPFYRSVGKFTAPEITDYLVMQMVCGPDVERGEPVVRNSAGFPSVFMPPTIRNPGDTFADCKGFNGFNSVSSIYNYPVNSVGGKYEGFVSYLAAQARSSVVTDQKVLLDTWWTKNTEAQMQKAFAEYSASYEKNIVTMIRGIHSQGRSALNRGPVYNGTMNAAFQEQKVYMSLLSELLNPSKQYALDMNVVINQSPTLPALKKVETQFSILKGLINQLKVVTIDKKEKVQSSLQNDQLEAQLNNIQKSLVEVATMLGVGDSKEKPTIELTQSQRQVAVAALEGMQSVAYEIMMYGIIANAVTWDKIDSLKKVDVQRQQYNNEVQKIMARMGSMTAVGR